MHLMSHLSVLILLTSKKAETADQLVTTADKQERNMDGLISVAKKELQHVLYQNWQSKYE